MKPVTELLELIAQTAEAELSLDSPISLDELPAEGGLYAEAGEGFTESTYYGKCAVKSIPVLFLCRHRSQKRGYEELCQIADYFQRLNHYPQGESFSWLNASISKEPSKIGRDEDGMWHFSCIIKCQIYY